MSMSHANIKMGDIAIFVSKLEAKKSQVTIGNIKEILAIISDLMYDDPEIIRVFLNNAKRRQKCQKQHS